MELFGVGAVRALAVAVALGATLLGGCASLPDLPPVDAAQPRWSGRMALSLDEGLSTARSVSASFDLYGRADAGTLVLSSPLGQQMLQLVWDAQGARWQTPDQVRRFDSMAELTEQALGTALPLPALFDWLSGRSTDGQVVVTTTGWSADLTDLAAGKLVARRTTPPATLRVRLDPP